MSKKHRSSKHKGAGCWLSCCMGWTIGVVVVVLIALLIILAIFTFPYIEKQYCKQQEQTELHKQFMSDQLWTECEHIATRKNTCLGVCEMQRPVGPVPTAFLPPDTTPAPLLTNVRLNHTWTPTHYNLRLQPWIYNESDARLTGSVEILMMASEATDFIVLHARNLTIDQSTMDFRVGTSIGEKVSIKDVEVDKARDFIWFYLYSPVVPSRQYYLKLDFTGTLLHEMEGFYRARYRHQGDVKYLAVTQFEETHARKAFPCFDEPSFKATFTVTIIRKPGFTALSNQELENTQIRGDWREDTFKKTPIMSTYILAMFVGAYTKSETTTPRGTKVRVWTQPDYVDYGKTALEVTGKIIEAFEDYTGIRYPLNKTDQVAIAEFSAGAMENWGLIVYLEGQFLINPQQSSTLEQRAAIGTIAHEIAHQWFGNLVTMRWWDDTWLNEAFATYFGNYIGVTSVRPQWNEPLNFIRSIQTIMGRDTSFNSQPVRLHGLSAADDLHRAFDTITYDKGAAILRMFRYFVHEETFKKAVQRYLQEFSYSNAVKDDFISILDRQAREDGRITWEENRATLSMIATSWLDQANYPLIEVEDLRDGRLRVKQSRFTDLPSLEPAYLPPFSNWSWFIPLTYADSSMLRRQDNAMRWIYREDVVNFSDRQTPEWKLANVFFQGFYRVWYDDSTWNSLLTQLKTDINVVPVESRSEVVDDAMALAAEGYTDEVRALKATQFLVNETEYVVFKPFFAGRLKEYLRLLRGTPSYTLLNNYVLELIQPTYNRLGWTVSTNDQPMDRMLRVDVLTEACERQYQPCVLEALKQFDGYVNTVNQGAPLQTNPIDPDLRGLVYCMGMKHGNEEVFQFLLTQLIRIQGSEEFMASEINSLVLGLICAEEATSFRTMLNFLVQTNISALFEALAARPGAILRLWEYLDQNWAIFPRGVSKEAIVWILTEYFATPSDLQKVRHFISDHQEIHPLFAEDIIAKVKANVNWVKQNEPAIRDWLLYTRRGLQPPTITPEGGRSKRSILRSVERSIGDYTAGLSPYGRHPKMGSGHRSKYVKNVLKFENVEDVFIVFRYGKMTTVPRKRRPNHHLKSRQL